LCGGDLIGGVDYMRRRKQVDLSLSKCRSAISNGTHLLSDLDHRGAWARRLRDLMAAHLSDLGGADAVSESERVLIRRSAMLTLQLELLEQRFALNEGGEASSRDLEAYQRCTNTLRRTLESLGLRRRPRDVTTPLEYARQRERAEARP
jgi:hypothetical protein